MKKDVVYEVLYRLNLIENVLRDRSLSDSSRDYYDGQKSAFIGLLNWFNVVPYFDGFRWVLNSEVSA